MNNNSNEGPSTNPNRKADIIETPVDDDLLLYDSTRHQAFRLNESAAAIWRQCDGTSTARQIVGGDSARWTVLARLGADGLVAGVPAEPPTGGVSRRGFVRVGAAVAVGAAMAPVIEGIIVPTPAAAASQRGQNGQQGQGGNH